MLKERVSRGWSSREMVKSSQGSHHGTSTESRRHAQAYETRRLSGPVGIQAEPQGLQGASRNALMDRWIDHAERDGGGRVDVSMSRMTVARGFVSMSRRVPYHDRLCAPEVRLQGEAESAAQPTIFWGSQSVGGRSTGPLRATTITGLSRDRVIVVCTGLREQLTDHV